MIVFAIRGVFSEFFVHRHDGAYDRPGQIDEEVKWISSALRFAYEQRPASRKTSGGAPSGEAISSSLVAASSSMNGNFGVPFLSPRTADNSLECLLNSRNVSMDMFDTSRPLKRLWLVDSDDRAVSLFAGEGSFASVVSSGFSPKDWEGFVSDRQNVPGCECASNTPDFVSAISVFGNLGWKMKTSARLRGEASSVMFLEDAAGCDGLGFFRCWNGEALSGTVVDTHNGISLLDADGRKMLLRHDSLSEKGLRHPPRGARLDSFPCSDPLRNESDEMMIGAMWETMCLRTGRETVGARSGGSI